MAMLAWGPAELLILLLMSGAGQPTDLASLLSPRDYFQHKGIELTIDKMIELAGQDPKDAKTQIAQLVALRQLGDDAANFKQNAKYAEARKLIEEIASGAKAQDPLGFSKDFAARLLARLDGKNPPAGTPNTAQRDEGLAWFPAEASIVGVIDSRMNPGNLPGPRLPIDSLMKLVPPEGKKIFYEHCEKLGNIRIERVSFAYVHGEKYRGTMYARATGKMNHAWVANVLKDVGMKLGDQPQGKGDKITVIGAQGSEPAIALVGNTDIVIAGSHGGDVDAGKVMDGVLALRDKKQPNVFKGALKDDLAKIPAKATGLIVGATPQELRDEFKGSLGAFPHKIVAYMQRAATGTDFVVDATMANDADAKMFVQTVSKGRDMAVNELKKVVEPPIPGVSFQPLINTLESLQLEARGGNVRLQLLIADDTLSVFPMLFLWGARG